MVLRQYITEAPDRTYLTFRQTWKDDRLNFIDVGGKQPNPNLDQITSIDASYADKIWRPDVFFVDSRKQKRHKIMTDNVLLDIKAKFQDQSG